MYYILFDNPTNTDITAIVYKIMPSQGGTRHPTKDEGSFGIGFTQVRLQLHTLRKGML
jgi:hypothetical protein